MPRGCTVRSELRNANIGDKQQLLLRVGRVVLGSRTCASRVRYSVVRSFQRQFVLTIGEAQF
jgi:hypothetical protein